MGRRNSGRVRLDGLSQFKQRKYLKKNSPQGRKDGRDWAFYMLQNINKSQEENK